jgi:hypothetical protein
MAFAAVAAFPVAAAPPLFAATVVGARCPMSATPVADANVTTFSAAAASVVAASESAALVAAAPSITVTI